MPGRNEEKGASDKRARASRRVGDTLVLAKKRCECPWQRLRKVCLAEVLLKNRKSARRVPGGELLSGHSRP